MLASLPLYLFPFCLLAAAISDIHRFIIPNTLSIVLVAGFFLAFALSGLGWDVLRLHLITGALMLIVGFAMFAFKLCGAGDSKLLAAVGLWLGWPTFGHGLLMIAIMGGILSVVLIAARLFARWYPRFSLIFPPLARLAATEKLSSPYGVAIAAGALIAFPDSPLYVATIDAP